jgi:hypothetical protein
MHAVRTVYDSLAKGWPAIVEAERKYLEGLKDTIIGIANSVIASPDKSHDEKELAASYVEDFEFCFERMIKEPIDLAGLGALEAAAILLALEPIDSETRNKIAAEAINRSHTPGAKRSVEVRQKAAEDWEGPALQVAKEIRTQEPSIFQRDLQSKILNEVRCPPDMLIKKLSKWERDGQLPRRIPKFKK